MKKVFWLAIFFVVLSGHSKDNSCSPLTVPVRWVACKGQLCVNPSSPVSPGTLLHVHVNRPYMSMLSLRNVDCKSPSLLYRSSNLQNTNKGIKLFWPILGFFCGSFEGPSFDNIIFWGQEGKSSDFPDYQFFLRLVHIYLYLPWNRL